MALTEKVRIVIDVVTGNAKKDLKDVGDAAESTGKRFGTAGQLAGKGLDFIKTNAMDLAAAGAAAIVAFGVKSVNAFKDLALTTEKFSKSTGLAVEEASRWIAVGDDIGVGADTMASAFGKFTKTLGGTPEVFRQMGVNVATAADGTTDLNQTLLNSIDYLNGIEDPVERNAAAAQLFGKGWQSASRLLSMSSSEIVAAMDDVSEAQVIDDSEIAKAKRLEASLDELGDSVNDISLALGEQLIPALATTLETLSDVVKAGNDLMGGPFGKVADNLPIVGGLDNLNAALDSNRSMFDRATNVVATFIPGLDVAADATDSLSGKQEELTATTGDGIESVEEYEARLADQAAAMKEVEEGAANLEAGMRALVDATLAAGSSVFAAADAYDSMLTAMDESKVATDDSTTSLNEKEAADRKAMDSVLKYAAAESKAAEDTAKANGQQFTAKDAAQAQIDALNKVKAKFPELSPIIDDYIRKLQTASNPITTPIKAEPDLASVTAAHAAMQRSAERLPPITSDLKARIIAAGGGLMAGGDVYQSGLYTVGEQGREMVALPRGAHVYPHGQTENMLRGGMPMSFRNYHITVNVAAGAQPADVGKQLVSAISAYERANGTGWRS